MSKTELKTRRPKARNSAIVVGCIEERLLALAAEVPDMPGVNAHIDRVHELFDELKRSLSKTEEAE